MSAGAGRRFDMFSRVLGSFFLLIASLLILPGCSTYLSGYYYVPRPGVVTVPATVANEAPAATVFASVVGVRRGDEGANRPEAVEVRLRIDNGKDVLAIDPRTIELLTGTLVKFGPVEPLPLEPLTLQPNQSADILAVFPFAPGAGTGNVDLSALRLTARVSIAGKPVDAVFNFQRAVEVYVSPYGNPYYDPYYDPYFFDRHHFYGGYYRYRR
jgi:hypothetical protein